ncbi:MAG TPA: hypothetical protein IAC31_01070 [Candidatus Faecousia intestinigallinarum]|nr:hypothetical protein [Candidatus Faecousia intestinigallinarum]
MNEQTMEDILNALYDMVQDARSMPLSADKCVLERDKILDMLDEVMSKLPGELKQSRAIVDSRNDLISQARREAERIVREAQENAAKLITQESIYQQTKAKCQEMAMQTQQRMAQLRKASNEYMDDALRRTEEAIQNSLSEVRDTRVKFKALAEAQEKRTSITVDDDQD